MPIEPDNFGPDKLMELAKQHGIELYLEGNSRLRWHEPPSGAPAWLQNALVEHSSEIENLMRGKSEP